jgi:NADH-quinone oxidoreductase subunit G
MKMVNLTIDGKAINVPEGTLIVNAAKQAGIDIPVFCYHPKMEPVGMCRVCLVEVGRPVIDRATGEPVREEDGAVRMQFGPKLETACTTPVSEGMIVLGTSEKAKAGREDILEFLLTSHPLDCPICDKGGECPLQNLTMGFGPGESRYLYDEKMHMAKHVPLGELIYLDRERCIQCGRCVRFQDLVVDDPVIGFFQRGRSLEIVTYSDPGFDSVFSGNTTDICPVGALTTADFRFKARPWELRPAASICTQCPVGCNITFNTRREAASGGNWVIKRAMPRQNEWVNEIWMCDKGRFGYHYSRSAERLTQPLVRRQGKLAPATWDEALNLVAERLGQAGDRLLTIAGGRLSNEDLYNLGKLTAGLGGQKVLYDALGGGELTPQVGLAPGSNFADMGKGTAILVVASDLHEEAPIWWLRIKQAAERGAQVIVASPRPTRLDAYATQIIRYPYGSEAGAVLAMVNTLSAKRPDLPESVAALSRNPELKAAASAFAEAENAVILYGSEGTSLETSTALAQACQNLLLATGHVGRPNNGLLAVWQRANEQGASELGWRPLADLPAAMQAAGALYVIAADPAGDDPAYLAEGRLGSQEQAFLVVQDLFLTATARLADVVLPVQAWTEREGSFTSGERRVQRFFPAVPEPPDSLADFSVAAQIGQRLGMELESRLASRTFARLAQEHAAFAGLTYARLAEVVEQWPIVGRGDLYYGGTTYENSQGLGVQLPLAGPAGLTWPKLAEVPQPRIGLLAVPVTRLYDRGATLLPSTMLHQRIPEPYIVLNTQDAERLKIAAGAPVQLIPAEGAPAIGGRATARLDPNVPERVVLVPRSFGMAISGPVVVSIRLTERALV